MEATTIGKLQLLAIILAFFGWCMVSVHNEAKTQAALTEAKKELSEAKSAYEAGQEAMEKSGRQKEEIHARISEKKDDLEISLDAAGEWDALAIPAGVWEAIQAGGSFRAAGAAAGRYQDTVKGGSANDGRSGAPAGGR